MKLTIFAGILATALIVTGCVSTVNDRTTTGMPFVKDRVQGMYQRPVARVFQAAKTVVERNGTLVNEGTLYSQTNTVHTVQGKIYQANVWVRVEAVDTNVTSVTVQSRSKGGAGDMALSHEIEKQIALELVK
jgi:virulence-associated protein VapD